MRKNHEIVLQITKEQFSQLQTISNNNLPNESAALLFGVIKKQENQNKYYYTLNSIEEVKSDEPNPVSFILEDMGLIASIWSKAQENGLKLISIFHSHPSTSFISQTDKFYMKNMHRLYPGIIWTVFGNTDLKLKGFIYLNNHFERINIDINETI